MKTDAAYLHHILECIRRIEQNTAEGREVFFASQTLQDAVLRNLQTMSESAQRLSAESKATRPDIPWPRIAGLRNVLVHNYLGIDLEQVWQIVQRDIPVLKEAAQAMLRIPS